MKISYAITVCNELIEIQKLIPVLLQHKRKQDEIVILYDQKNGNEEVVNYLRRFSKLPNVQFWRGLDFNGHFADWKNILTSYCNGDYIFQIDADEIPNETLLNNLPSILENNPENEVYLVPRVNTVEGLTQEHINKWGWNVNDKGWVNFPDYQWRVWKNLPEIKWKNKVHEVLDGFKTYSALPLDKGLALYHPKTIDKQEKQNSYYESISN
jgi:hypothetical protein|tara:strand:- start:1744 stop:2376 length:633 start_codon:yes stop_codon:yes gene_type:complete